VWSDDLNATARLRDAMKFRNERHHVRHVFDHVATDDFIELVVPERIGHVSKIVNYVGICPGI
jgi:hypothetical protein